MNSLKDKIAKRKNKLKINKRDMIKWKQENIEKEKETNMEVKMVVWVDLFVIASRFGSGNELKALNMAGLGSRWAGCSA